MDRQSQSIKKLYYSIGEVSKIAELKQYVLRYWETEFKQLSPSKNKAGNRTYRQKDIDLILQIKNLLYNKKFTIEGARKMLDKTKGADKKQTVAIASNVVDTNLIITIRNELKSIIEDLRN
jgi:DNA-binding transcriptional MerR regulator